MKSIENDRQKNNFFEGFQKYPSLIVCALELLFTLLTIVTKCKAFTRQFSFDEYNITRLERLVLCYQSAIKRLIDLLKFIIPPPLRPLCLLARCEKSTG